MFIPLFCTIDQMTDTHMRNPFIHIFIVPNGVGRRPNT